MKIAVDTNRLVDFFRGDPGLTETLSRASTLVLPFIVLAELRAGFLGGKKSLENERSLVRFLGSPRCSIAFANEDTSHHYARLFQQLRKQGTPVPINDLWIAAICLQHDLHLLTRDQHFSKIPQLSCSKS